MNLVKKVKELSKKVLTGGIIIGSTFLPTSALANLEYLADEIVKREVTIPEENPTENIYWPEDVIPVEPLEIKVNNPQTITFNEEDIVKDTKQFLDTKTKREIKFYLNNPFSHIDPRVAFFYSISQILGKANDVLGKHLDDSAWFRVPSFLFNILTTHAGVYYAHELGHSEIEQKKRLKFNTDFSNWMHGAPALSHLPPTRKYSDEELLHENNAGLNSTTVLASHVWRNNIINDNIIFDNALLFLIASFDHSTYYFLGQSQSEYDPFDIIGFVDIVINMEGQNFPGNTCFSWLKNRSIQKYNRIPGDVGAYVLYLQNCQGIDLTRIEDFGQALAANLLTWHTYESVYALYNYVFEGERVTEPFKFDLEEGWELAPPLVSLYLTDKGGLYDIETILFHSDHSLNLHLQIPADYFIGEGRNVPGIGMEYTYETDLFSLGHSFNINTNNQYNIAWKLQLGIFEVEISHNNEDQIEKTKRNPQGTNVNLVIKGKI